MFVVVPSGRVDNSVVLIAVVQQGAAERCSAADTLTFKQPVAMVMATGCESIRITTHRVVSLPLIRRMDG